jgi:cyclic pyranopterin phosphate synthase
MANTGQNSYMNSAGPQAPIRRKPRMALANGSSTLDRASQKPSALIDPFQRAITYLRVSVTDRCDFRCVYCMSEHMTFLPKADLLSLEELDRLCSAFVAKGVTKLRLTGGEPLVRRGIMTLVSSLSRHLASGALQELTLTTNGSQLEKYASELKANGIKRKRLLQGSMPRRRPAYKSRLMLWRSRA